MRNWSPNSDNLGKYGALKEAELGSGVHYSILTEVLGGDSPTLVLNP